MSSLADVFFTTEPQGKPSVFNMTTRTFRLCGMHYTSVGQCYSIDQDDIIMLEFTYTFKEDVAFTPITKLSSITRYHIFSTSCSKS